MKGRVITAFLVLASLQLGWILKAEAQAGNVCYGAFIWYWPDPLPSSGDVCTGPAQGPFSMICFGPTGNCPAPPPSVCPTCNNVTPAAASPINLTTGNTYIQENDIHIPGLGGGLSVVRTWNSTWPSTQSSFQTGMFGPNWRSTYEERVFLSGNNMVYLRGDGAFWFFTQSGSTWKPASPANVTATLTLNGSQWTLAFQNGEQRFFNYTSGSLASIVDRNGNATQLTYDGSNRLTTVTDPASRHLYLSYNDTSYPSFVTSITSDIGLSLSYSYDSQGRLSTVTEPDQSTLSFTYNSQSLITTVSDSQGKTLESHTYDSQGRGLTSSRALGVEAVTVAYPNE